MGSYTEESSRKSDITRETGVYNNVKVSTAFGLTSNIFST